MAVTPKLGLDKKKWKQVIIHAGIVGGAALMTYVMEHIGSDDFGNYTPLVMGTAAILLKYLQKLASTPEDGSQISALGVDDASWRRASLDD